MSFCRITGRARNLPKPNFFPLIPPISPADARRLCRITAKRMDDHNFVPLLEIGKRPEGIKCHVTGKTSRGGSAHQSRDDYKYVTPILKKEAMDRSDIKTFEDLQKVLKRLKSTLADGEKDKKYVYLLSGVLCGLIVPAEVEEAVRIGELESVSLSRSCDKAAFKIRGKPTLFVPLKEILDVKTASLINGSGQNSETLTRQKKILEDRKRKTLANAKIFEELERKGDEELSKDLERPGQGKRARYVGAGKSKEARQFREKMANFREMFLPEGNMSGYGENWPAMVRPDLSQLDWTKIGKIRSADLEMSGSPRKRSKLIQPFDDKKIDTKLKKRPTNIFVPDGLCLEIVPMTDEIVPNDFDVLDELIEFIRKSKDRSSLDDYSSRSSLNSIFATGPEGDSAASAIKILPTLDEFERVVKYLTFGDQKEVSVLSIRLGCMYDHGDGLKFCESVAIAPKDANVIVGAVIRVPPPIPGADVSQINAISRFFPGEMVGDNFVPGQRMASANGEFIPAASIRSGGETLQFLPGVVAKGGQFVLGQFITELNNEIHFVRGQVVHTTQGPKFVHGQTITTPDGIKFVAGVQVDQSFVSGVLVDAGTDNANFVPGQLLGLSDPEDPIRFIPGQFEDGSFVPGQNTKGVFYPGQMINVPDLGLTFIHGEISTNPKNPNAVFFMPGVYSNESEDPRFHPGLVFETPQGLEFVGGKLAKVGAEAIFVPGKVNERDGKFDKAVDEKAMSCLELPTFCQGINESALSVIFKKAKAKTGVMVLTKDGPKFYLENEIPEHLRNAEIVPGRMECFEDGPKFVPGKIMEIHGVKTFIPGKILKDSHGKDIFVPGKMINGKNGPKFIPGQVIQAENGEEKFIPGQVVNGIFVPGMIIETKSGPLFIPGQVVRTDEGLKFVPGQIVEMEHGALFVPGEVIDSPTEARFVPGQVVDTPDGPRLLPPDIKGDGNLEYLVQGFDINQEEARLIAGGSETALAGELTDFLGGIGDASIGGEALAALADGFESFDGNAIMLMGEGVDVEKILHDESLDSCDSPATRKKLHSVFISTFSELCKWIDEVFDHLSKYMDTRLNDKLWMYLLSPDADKLYPALEGLKQFCRNKNPDDPPEYEILNLIAGMVFCSLPGALKECSTADGEISEENLRSILNASIEESVRGILEEDGMVSGGRIEDIRSLVRLAKDLEFDDNESFFAKVVAVTEGRCGSKFMNDLLTSLRNGGDKFSITELLERLVNVLAPRLHLQTGFTELTASSPDFIEDLLESLKSEASTDEVGGGQSAIDVLHRAITKAVNRRCQRQLDDVVHRVELDSMLLEKDRDIRSMLEEAIGLARYMHKDDVTDTLNDLLADPIRLEVIRDDPVIMDVLNKILVMRKLSAGDSRRKKKLERLRQYHSDDEEDDTSLREMIRLCDALTRLPHQGQLKKSKSMIKKSKSTIVSAKDIPMTAFMAMKSTAASGKDEKWLQNFLSESLVDDVPWECSKALIILKQGYQAIIPREAARSILLGEASYTLIDDSGVEFYLSPKDKKNRKRQGLEDVPKRRVTILEEGDEVPEKRKSPPKNVEYDENEFERPTNGKSSLRRNSDESDLNGSNPDLASYYGSKSYDDLDPSKPIGSKSYHIDSKLYGGLGSKSYDLDSKKSNLGSSSFELDSTEPPRRPFRSKYFDEEEITAAALSSMEKYRPCNYEIGPGRVRGDGDDINDIRDYYSSLATRQRAMRRVYDLNRDPEDEEEQYQDEMYQPQIPVGRGRQQLQKPRQAGRQPPHQAPLQQQQQQQQQQRSMYDDFEPDHVSPVRQEGPFVAPQSNLDPYGYPTTNYYGQQPYHMQLAGYGMPPQQQQLQQPPYQPYPAYQMQPDPYSYNPAGYNPVGYTPVGYDDRRMPLQKPELEETTRTLLERARAVRQNPVWDEEIRQSKKASLSKYNWDTDTFEQQSQAGNGGPAPAPAKPEPKRETALSSKTQQLLSKLKESTAALEDMSQQKPTSFGGRPSYGEPRGVESKPATKKPSRFYRRDDWSDPRSNRGSSSGGGYSVYDLADDILGENVRPSREPALPSRRLTHPRPDDEHTSSVSGRLSGSTSNGSRKYSEPTSSYKSYLRGTPERSRDSSSRYSPVRTTTRKFDDDEDLDTMINDLKKKTAGRDMYKVLSEMEGREITPPSRRYNNNLSSPSPPPITSRNGRKPEPAKSYGSGSSKYGGQNRYSSDDEDERGNGYSGRYGSSAKPQQQHREAPSYRYYNS